MLSKGKGNKIIGIPSAKVVSREEYLVDVAVLADKQVLVINTANKSYELIPKEWKAYLAERGRRGLKLPPKWRATTSLTAKEEKA